MIYNEGVIIRKKNESTAVSRVDAGEFEGYFGKKMKEKKAQDRSVGNRKFSDPKSDSNTCFRQYCPVLSSTNVQAGHT